MPLTVIYGRFISMKAEDIQLFRDWLAHMNDYGLLIGASVHEAKRQFKESMKLAANVDMCDEADQ